MNPQDVFSIVVYENQRRYPLKGWSNSLLPTDRWQWSTNDGSEELTKDIAETEKLPAGFEWKSDWNLLVHHVDENGKKSNDDGDKAQEDDEDVAVLTKPTDADGWRYSFDFPTYSGYHPTSGFHDWVRRRRWRRVAVRAGTQMVFSKEHPDELEVWRSGGQGNCVRATKRDADVATTVIPEKKAEPIKEVVEVDNKHIVTVSPDTVNPDNNSLSSPVLDSPVHPPQRITEPTPEEQRFLNILKHWEMHKAIRRGQVTINIEDVHLPECFDSYIEVSHRGTVQTTSSVHTANSHKEHYGFEAYVSIADDNEPVVIRMKEDGGSLGSLGRGDSCRGEAILPLRTAEMLHAMDRDSYPGFAKKVAACGTYKELGTAILNLYPQPMDENSSNVSADALGTIQVSWTFEIRESEIMHIAAAAQESDPTGGANDVPTLTGVDAAAATRPSQVHSSSSSHQHQRNSAHRHPKFCNECGNVSLRCSCAKGPDLGANHGGAYANGVSPSTTGESLLHHHHPPPKHVSGRLIFKPISCTNVTQQSTNPNIYLVLHGVDGSGKPFVCKSSQHAKLHDGHMLFEPAHTFVFETYDAHDGDNSLNCMAWDHFSLQSDKCVGVHFFNMQHSIAGNIEHLQLVPRPDERDPKILAHAAELGSITAFVRWIPYNYTPTDPWKGGAEEK